MVSTKGALGFGTVNLNRGARGGTFAGYDGVAFDFYPSVAVTAQKAFALSSNIRSMKVPLEESVRTVIRPSIAENFYVGGRPAWAPLTAGTIKKKGFINPNVHTGKLAGVAQQRNIWDIGRDTAIVRGGALLGRVPYALFVQAGHANRQSEENSIAAYSNVRSRKTEYMEVGGGETPARPYLMIQPEDAAKIHKIFGVWIDMRIAQTWGK